jgi:hypothetical protein
VLALDRSSSTPSGRPLPPTCPNTLRTTIRWVVKRPRISDRDCFEAILFRLVTGCSWDVARRARQREPRRRCVARRDERLSAGAFEHLVDEAINVVDKVIGLDLSEAWKGCWTRHRPVEMEQGRIRPTVERRDGNGRCPPTPPGCDRLGDRGRQLQRHDPARPNRDDVAQRGLLSDIETLWLDRGMTQRSPAPASLTMTSTPPSLLRRPRGWPKGHWRSP